MNSASRQLRRAFTLIELLVVIAIIAILTAIIFPVFATVRENARQSSSLSNLHAISSALGQFQLDNKRNPDVLFGYVYYQYDPATMSFSGVPAGMPVPMDKAYAQAQADAQLGVDVSGKFPGLYPEYIHDIASFQDANNTSNGDNSAKVTTTINTLDGTGKLTIPAPTQDFYKVDAYDVSPRVTNTNKLDMATYVARYQASWTDVNNALNNPCTTMGGVSTCDGATTSSTNYYTHQMRWKNPPADTYVTSTTYHVPNADTVLVLWEDGSVRKLNTRQFMAQDAGQDAPSGIGVTAAGISAANFWKLTPAR